MQRQAVLRTVGKAFISAGALILLFAVYELWGTSISESRAQHRLKEQFGVAASAIGPTSTSQPEPAATALPANPAPPNGAVAIIDIPKIGVDAAVVEGVGESQLENGPGHYPGSPLPGQAGNAAIAGHRTTYGAPFYRLNELKIGDAIYVSTKASPTPWKYVVASSASVSPGDVAVLDPTPDNRLTLTTCTPRFSATQRLVVVSELVGAPGAAPAPTATTRPAPRSSGLGPAEPSTLSGHGAGVRGAVLWGLLWAAVWALTLVLAHRHHGWRRWAAYAVASPVFLVTLYFFFENAGRLVPTFY